MNLDAILADDPKERADALAAIASAPDHVRSALAAKVVVRARDAAAALALKAEDGSPISTDTTILSRACAALAILRVESAKTCLLRIADEGTTPVKTALSRVLRGTRTMEGRAVLVRLLSDDDARVEALLAIGAAPWPEVLPDLIEIAEADDRAVRLAIRAIARCGATAGPAETNAASDFLLEQLDDDKVFPMAVEAILRFGRGFPGVLRRAKLLAKQPGERKVAALCLVAAEGPSEDDATLRAIAEEAPAIDPDVARAFLGPWRSDGDERVKRAANRAWKSLAL